VRVGLSLGAGGRANKPARGTTWRTRRRPRYAMGVDLTLPPVPRDSLCGFASSLLAPIGSSHAWPSSCPTNLRTRPAHTAHTVFRRSVQSAGPHRCRTRPRTETSLLFPLHVSTARMTVMGMGANVDAAAFSSAEPGRDATSHQAPAPPLQARRASPSPAYKPSTRDRGIGAGRALGRGRIHTDNARAGEGAGYVWWTATLMRVLRANLSR
jgi:hypothetical protein